MQAGENLLYRTCVYSFIAHVGLFHECGLQYTVTSFLDSHRTSSHNSIYTDAFRTSADNLLYTEIHIIIQLFM